MERGIWVKCLKMRRKNEVSQKINSLTNAKNAEKQ